MNQSNLSISKARFAGSILAVVLVCISLIGIMTQGFNLGIDFKGGYITEFSTSKSISQNKLEALIQKNYHGVFSMSSAEDNTYWVVRQDQIDKLTQPSSDTNQSTHAWIEQVESSEYFKANNILLTVLDSDFLDSQIGKLLIEQGGLALLTAVLIVMVYLAMRFEWRFAVGAILALFHDVTLVLGLFAWTQLEVNLTVLASLLAIIGYSLNDSIIVADKIREFMQSGRFEKISDVINAAIKTTLTRTLITSGTTLTTIAALWWLAGLPLFGFSTALFFGILFGTLSSISIAGTFPELIGLRADYYQVKKAEVQALMNSEP